MILSLKSAHLTKWKGLLRVKLEIRRCEIMNAWWDWAGLLHLVSDRKSQWWTLQGDWPVTPGCGRAHEQGSAGLDEVAGALRSSEEWPGLCWGWLSGRYAGWLAVNIFLPSSLKHGQMRGWTGHELVLVRSYRTVLYIFKNRAQFWAFILLQRWLQYVIYLLMELSDDS